MKYSFKNKSMLIDILYKVFFLIIMLLVFVGCSNETFDSEEELWTYLKDESNGYLQKKSVNGFDFSLVYRPTDLVVNQELTNRRNFKNVDQLRSKYGKYLYFKLSMSRANKEILSSVPRNKDEFGEMVNQLAFGIGNKVHLFTKQKDTIELADFAYPRMYGMTASTDILFVYPREEAKLKDEYLIFTIEDLGFYTGEIKFKVPIENINNEPRLKL